MDVNFRATVRGQNPGQRMDAGLNAEIAARSGGLRMDANVHVRGGGVRAHFHADGFRNAGPQRMNVSVSATGLGEIGGAAAQFYGGNVDGFQFSASVNQKQMRQRMRGVDHMQNRAQIAINMGELQPNQGARFQAQIGDIRNFASMQSGGMSMNVNIGDYMGSQQAYGRLGNMEQMLGGYGMAQQMMGDQLGGLQNQFGQFQGQVGDAFGQMQNQFGAFQGQVGQSLGFLQNQMGQFGSQMMDMQQGMGVFGQQIASNTSGLASLNGMVGDLSTQLGGLGGVVGGLTGKFDQFQTQFGAYKGTTDTQITDLLKQTKALQEELIAVRKENVELKTGLNARIDDVNTTLNTKIDSLSTDVNTKIAGLRTDIAGLDTRLTTLQGDLKTTTESLQKAITDGDTKLAGDLTATKTKLEGDIKAAEDRMNANLNAYKEEVNGRFANVQTQLDTSAAQIKDLDGKFTLALTNLDTKLTTATGDLKKDLEAQRADITAAQGMLRDQGAQIGKLQGQVQTAQSDIKGLQAGQADLTKRMGTAEGNINQLETNQNTIVKWLGPIVNSSNQHLNWWDATGTGLGWRIQMQGNKVITGDPILLDLKGDGLNLGGRTKTDQLTGTMTSTNWTQKGGDDAFLLVDATSLRAAGFGDIKDGSGKALDGQVQFRDGIRIRVPGEDTDRVITDGYELLQALNTNNAGSSNNKLDANDPAFKFLSLFTDTDGDGTIGKDELASLSSKVSNLAVGGSEKKTDAFGNAVSRTDFTLADGTVRTGGMADVNFGGVGT